MYADNNMATVAKAKEYSFGRCLIFICLALALKFVFVSYFRLFSALFSIIPTVYFVVFPQRSMLFVCCVNNVKLATTCNTLKVFQEVLIEN